MNDWERLLWRLRRRMRDLKGVDLITEIWLAFRWLACLLLIINCPITGYSLVTTAEPLPTWAKEGGTFLILGIWLWAWYEIEQIPLTKDSS